MSDIGGVGPTRRQELAAANNPWIIHRRKIKQQYPHLFGRELTKKAQESYVKKPKVPMVYEYAEPRNYTPEQYKFWKEQTRLKKEWIRNGRQGPQPFVYNTDRPYAPGYPRPLLPGEVRPSRKTKVQSKSQSQTPQPQTLTSPLISVPKITPQQSSMMPPLIPKAEPKFQQSVQFVDRNVPNPTSLVPRPPNTPRQSLDQIYGRTPVSEPVQFHELAPKEMLQRVSDDIIVEEEEFLPPPKPRPPQRLVSPLQEMQDRGQKRGRREEDAQRDEELMFKEGVAQPVKQVTWNPDESEDEQARRWWDYINQQYTQRAQRPEGSKNPFIVLTVTPKITPEELRSLYLKIVKMHHPDRFMTQPEAVQKQNHNIFVEKTWAIQQLQDPVLRAEWERDLKEHRKSGIEEDIYQLLEDWKSKTSRTDFLKGPFGDRKREPLAILGLSINSPIWQQRTSLSEADWKNSIEVLYRNKVFPLMDRQLSGPMDKEMLEDLIWAKMVLQSAEGMQKVGRKLITAPPGGLIGGIAWMKYTDEVQRFLNEDGWKTVKGITLCRAPVVKGVNFTLNALSLGGWNKQMRKLGYDEMFHVWALIAVGGGESGTFGSRSRGVTRQESETQLLWIEKNQTILMGRVSSDPGGYYRNPRESLRVATPQPPRTLQQMIDLTRRQMGDERFFDYRGDSWNCQDFLLNFLSANGISSPEARQFLYQDVGTMFSNLPPGLRQIAKSATDLAGIWDFIRPSLIGQ